MRAAQAILSTENLLHNVAVIKSHALNMNIIAMVKANAYGHGLRSVSRRLQEHVYSLGVASIDEALALRKVGITIPITLMEGVFEPHELAIAAQENFHVVFHEPMQLEWLQSADFFQPLTAWMKIDTGMGRLGFALAHAETIYRQLSSTDKLQQPIGIMSHFACADYYEHPLNQMQINRFAQFSQDKSGLKSFCNSAALFTFKDHQYDVIRPGLALYGISPIANKSATDLGVKPVMTLKTNIVAIRMARKNSFIGYGARFQCPEDMPIGVIAIGYGDGYPSSVKDGAPVLVNGTLCAIAGRISMDMATVDLRPYPQAKINDPVILWGDGLPIEQVVRFTNNSVYDLLTGVQLRVRFCWT